jgi:hypothetical protein
MTNGRVHGKGGAAELLGDKPEHPQVQDEPAGDSLRPEIKAVEGMLVALTPQRSS